MHNAPSVTIPTITTSIKLFSPGAAPFQPSVKITAPASRPSGAIKNTSRKKCARPKNASSDNLRQGYLFKFNNFLEVATDTVKTAGADGNSRLVLQAVREGTRILNFMTKLDVKLDQDTVYRLLASPPVDHPEQSPAHRPPVYHRHPPDPGRQSLLPLPGASRPTWMTRMTPMR